MKDSLSVACNTKDPWRIFDRLSILGTEASASRVMKKPNVPGDALGTPGTETASATTRTSGFIHQSNSHRAQLHGSRG